MIIITQQDLYTIIVAHEFVPYKTRAIITRKWCSGQQRVRLYKSKVYVEGYFRMVGVDFACVKFNRHDPVVIPNVFKFLLMQIRSSRSL